jgi:hypothetical protein
LQLFVAVLQCFGPHAVAGSSATQPLHELFTHIAPLVQLPQSYGLPQLSTVAPQRLLHQFGCV